MPHLRTRRIEKLSELIQPVLPDDSMPEAGRKILRANLLEVLQYEGELTGDNAVHGLHQMRVATRRLRSAFRVFESYYPSKVICPLARHLKATARRLGDVRDMDVMIHNLKQHFDGQGETIQGVLHPIIERVETQRETARHDLFEWLDSANYRGFLKEFMAFLERTDKSNLPPDSRLTPYQVRHVAPVIFHQHLASVRAFDAVLPTDRPEILHALRIEFKRLRYVLTFFSEVMGSTVSDFIEEVKTIQDYLGKLNDAVTAQHYLTDSNSSGPEYQAAVQAYRDSLAREAQTLIIGFPEIWTHFNTRTVQRKLSDALLVMR